MTGRDFVEKIADELAKGDYEAAKEAAIVYADWLEEKGLDSWANAWRGYTEVITVKGWLGWPRDESICRIVASVASLWCFRREAADGLITVQYGESPLFRAFPLYRILNCLKRPQQ